MDMDDRDPELEIIKGAGYTSSGQQMERGGVTLHIISGASDDGRAVTVSVNGQLEGKEHSAGIYLMNSAKVREFIKVLEAAADFSDGAP